MTKAEQHWENCLRKSTHNINHNQIFHTFLDTGTPKISNQCNYKLHTKPIDSAGIFLKTDLWATYIHIHLSIEIPI